MSEVYWLGGADQTGWEKESSRLGMRPAWIDEVHWCGLPPQPAWISSPPAFAWPGLPRILETRLLQDVARSLLAGERSLVLLAAPIGVVLLTSPRAVGRLNLSPAVRLSSWGALPEGSAWEAIAQAEACPMPTQPQNTASGAWQILFPPTLPTPQEDLAEAAHLSDLPQPLLDRCQSLRQEISDPAELLWQLLDHRQVNQAEFSRLQELDGQILDFFCPQTGLVILIDHRADMEDAQRMHVFAQHGLRVLRFWNNQVIEDTPEVLQTIWEAVSAADSSPARAIPGSSPTPAETSAAAWSVELSPSPGGIAGLNALCRELKPGWRGLLVETSPGQPLIYLAAEGL